MNKVEYRELLAYLLQGFNDYENPIQMDAEHVRNRLVELVEEFMEDEDGEA